MAELLTTAEAAAVLGVDDSRVRQLIAAGRLPARKYGAMWLVQAEDLDQVGERRPGRPRKLVITDPSMPLQTWTGLKEELREAETADDVRDAYDRLLEYYRRPGTLKSDYLGAPQTPEEAAWRAIEGFVPDLPEDKQALIVPVLDQTVRERPSRQRPLL